MQSRTTFKNFEHESSFKVKVLAGQRKIAYFVLEIEIIAHQFSIV